MLTPKPFLFYVVNTPTGFAYYVDNAGVLRKASISLGIGDDGVDISINDPNGWMNSTLGFMRNAQLYGFNRSYSVPQELVKDAAYIFRTVVNQGAGIQEPMTMIIFQYNASPLAGEPNYQFYYKGVLDVPNFVNTVGEGVQVNMIEGGFQQLYKTAENTVFEIPCDGSIPENIRVNLDGMLVQDTLTYQLTPMQGTEAPSGNGVHILSMALVGEDGDSYGVVTNSPNYDIVSGSTYPQASNDFALQFQSPTTVNVSGSITVRPFDTNHPAQFNLGWFTSLSQGDEILGGGHSGLGVPAVGLYVVGAGQPSLVWVRQETTFNFSFTVQLAALENLFLYWSDVEGSQNMFIVGGSMQVQFNTSPPVTKCWAITWFDVFKLLVKYICTTYSTNGNIYNYAFNSTLLQNNLNLVLTSGDALRAAGDPNYQKFYNAAQTNPNFPNINLSYSYGPVIKTTIAECFRAINVILNASMSTQILPGQNESVFVESKGYVFDSTVTNLDNGEVTDVKTQPALDLFFTLFKVGYNSTVSDQKAGKWSWCSTAEFQAPINTIPSKTFELICPYIADPFIIQRLIADIDDTSYTRNSSDNSVFIINTDPSTEVADGETASFISLNTFPANPDTAGNTNAKMIVNQLLQPVMCPTVNGSYFSYSTNAAIFLFNQAALAGTPMSVDLTITGQFLGQVANALLGTMADTAVFNLVINGAIFQTWTVTATGASTPININFAGSRNFTFKDCVYLTCTTSATGTVSDATAQLTINDGGGGATYLVATGSAITIQPGTPNALVALPTISTRLDGNSLPVVSSGFQYFQFNTYLSSSENNFDVNLDIAGFIRGGTSNTGSWDVYVNGEVIHTLTWPSTAAVSAIADNFSFNQSFQLGDLVWIAGSATNTSVWFTKVDIDFVSTQIFARDLLRVQYDAISGIPSLVGYLTMPGRPIPGRSGMTPPVLTNIPITTGPGAPFNIEQLTVAQIVATHGNYLRGVLYDQIPGILAFGTMSKNQNLSFTRQGVTFQDNADVPISSLAAPLFKPRWITYKTRVQSTYAETLTGAYNAHGVATYNMVPFNYFPWDLKQKPALNEMQEWKTLCSPLTDLSVLDNLSISGVNFINMSPNSIWASILSGDQWVPEGTVLPPKYHNFPRNQALYNQQITNWLNQNDYWVPVQIGDPHPVQLYSRDLNQVTLNLINSATGAIVQTVNMTSMSSPAITLPIYLWEADIDTSGLTAGNYYLQAVAGTGSVTAVLITQGWAVQVDWPKTLAFEYTHSSNKESMIFDTGFSGFMRVFGMYDNTAKQKLKAAWYVDTRQSSLPLNSFRYETWTLFAAMQDGTPDFVIDKLTGILLCDGCLMEGQGVSINEGETEWELGRPVGSPKAYPKIEVRPTNRLDGVGATAAGADSSAAMLITLDQGGFSPNAGNAGGTDPDIIQIQINQS